ncbi:hypothetical protein COBT_000501 [Conglomerata obtusa]
MQFFNFISFHKSLIISNFYVYFASGSVVCNKNQKYNRKINVPFAYLQCYKRKYEPNDDDENFFPPCIENNIYSNDINDSQKIKNNEFHVAESQKINQNVGILDAYNGNEEKQESCKKLKIMKKHLNLAIETPDLCLQDDLHSKINKSVNLDRLSLLKETTTTSICSQKQKDIAVQESCFTSIKNDIFPSKKSKMPNEKAEYIKEKIKDQKLSKNVSDADNLQSISIFDSINNVNIKKYVKFIEKTSVMNDYTKFVVSKHISQLYRYNYNHTIGLKSNDKHPNTTFLIQINDLLDNLIKNELKLRLFMVFVANQIVELCKNSPHKNRYAPFGREISVFTKNGENDFKEKKPIYSKIIKCCLNADSAHCSVDIISDELLDNFQNKMLLLNHKYIKEINCGIILSINKLKKSALIKIMSSICSNTDCKTYVYNVNDNYWLYDSNYINFIFFNCESFMNNTKTENTFHSRSILDRFFCFEIAEELSFVFHDSLYHGFVNHYLTFDSLDQFFGLNLPKTKLNFNDNIYNELKCVLIELIDDNYKNIEILMPQCGFLTLYFTKIIGAPYKFTCSKQIFKYVCFLQLFEIFLKLDWQSLLDAIKSSIKETESYCKDNPTSWRSKRDKNDFSGKINFFNAFKIYFNDISIFLLFPYLNNNCLKRYVNLIQWENLYYIKSYVKTHTTFSQGNINITFSPTLIISRLFFANEMLINQNDESTKNLMRNNNKTEIHYDKNETLCFPYSNVLFSESILYHNIQKCFLYRYFELKNRIKELIYVCCFYLENTSNEWKNDKLCGNLINSIEMIQYIKTQIDLPDEKIQMLPKNLQFVSLSKKSKIGLHERDEVYGNKSKSNFATEIKVHNNIYEQYKNHVLYFLYELSNNTK